MGKNKPSDIQTDGRRLPTNEINGGIEVPNPFRQCGCYRIDGKLIC